MSLATVNTSSVINSGRTVVQNGSTELSSPIRAKRLLEQKVQRLLDRHLHFRGRADFIQCKIVGTSLCLDGCLPSYYLKQLAQEAIRELEGNFQVENRIVVASSVGEVVDTALPTIERSFDSTIRKPR